VFPVILNPNYLQSNPFPRAINSQFIRFIILIIQFSFREI